MSTYYPDLWVIIKTTNSLGASSYKVFASWRGGYMSGDSWKLNSGIVGATYQKGYYSITGYSGSVYEVHNENYGMSFYSEGILAGWLETYAGQIELLSEKDAIAYLDGLAGGQDVQEA